MTDHTPGPWAVYFLNGDPTSHYGNLRITSKADGHDIAALIPNGKNAERWEANARLIAAAPDLLAALHNAASLLRALATPDDPVAQAALQGSEAAIAKARGVGKKH